jgi:hypothetical protein
MSVKKSTPQVYRLLTGIRLLYSSERNGDGEREGRGWEGGRERESDRRERRGEERREKNRTEDKRDIMSQGFQIYSPPIKTHILPHQPLLIHAQWISSFFGDTGV